MIVVSIAVLSIIAIIVNRIFTEDEPYLSLVRKNYPMLKVILRTE